jgi:hypothetical protein
VAFCLLSSCGWVEAGFVTLPTFVTGEGLDFVAVGDFNGDGVLDIVTANFFIEPRHGVEANDIRVCLGSGDGTFRQSRTYRVSGLWPTAVAVGDFNGDGIPDLAVASQGSATVPYAGTVSILLGNGDGTFQDPQDNTVGGGASSLAVGDFNGDGILDLAVASTGSYPQSGWTVNVLLGNGDGTFQAAQGYDVGAGSYAVAVGDFNGDGIPDLVTSGGSLLLGKGDGTFQPGPGFAITADLDARSLAVADFNGDGILDLAMANRGTRPNNFTDGNVTVLLGNGDGSFQPPQSYAAGSSYSSVDIGDFNGDGIPDLAVANRGTWPNGNVTVLLGNGDGSFQPAQNYAAGPGPYWVAVGDLNGDGYPDLAVGNGLGGVVGVGEVTVLLNDANWP